MVPFFESVKVVDGNPVVAFSAPAFFCEPNELLHDIISVVQEKKVISSFFIFYVFCNYFISGNDIILHDTVVSIQQK